jgi:hypothetical protein
MVDTSDDELEANMERSEGTSGEVMLKVLLRAMMVVIFAHNRGFVGIDLKGGWMDAVMLKLIDVDLVIMRSYCESQSGGHHAKSCILIGAQTWLEEIPSEALFVGYVSIRLD